MLDILIAYLRDVYKSILMHADVDKRAEVDNVTHCSRKHHIGLEILKIENIVAKNRGWQRVSDVASRLFKLADNVNEGRLADAELCGNRFGSLFVDLLTKLAELTLADVLCGIAEHFKERLRGGI